LGILALLSAVAEARGAVKPASDGSATREAIEALDTDHSGRVERAEVEAFAKSQGLNADDVRAEFKDLDTNGDGELEADEISNTLADPEGAADTPAAAPAAAAAPAKAAAPVAVAAPAAAAPVTSSSELHLEAMEDEAKKHAGKALAEVFARTAALALEARGKDAERAKRLEEAAKSLRGQTAEIKRTAAAQTVQAATEAAQAVLVQASQKVKALEAEADKAEVDAKQRRAEAKAAMERAMKAQAEMSDSVRKLKSQF